MLELENLHAYYGLSHVLNGITLRVGTGEVVGLFGRNGVGKTTTLRCIAGWVRETSGSIKFDDQDLRTLRVDEVARAGVAYIPEDRRIFRGLSVEDNLKIGLMQSRRTERAAAREKLDEIYQRFPKLGELRRRDGTSLSGGEQQMLAIARALMGSPRLLLIDEPTEGLAPIIVDEVFKFIDELRGRHISILLVEQNVKMALRAADRFYALRRGEIVLQGEGGDAAMRKALIEAIAV